jgi:hypothetical protein
MDGHFFEFFALGSDCSLQLITPFRSVAEDAAVAVEREVARIEACYSRYRPDSELSRKSAMRSIPRKSHLMGVYEIERHLLYVAAP